MHTLLIEDNIALAQTVVRYLASHNISCTLRTDGADWYSEAMTGSYDVIILDIELPHMNGIEICRKLRDEWKNTPIIMLTSRNTQGDIITGLDYGADDYLGKPCDYRELVARIRALGRRTQDSRSTEVLHRGKLTLDQEKHSVTWGGELVDLSKREYELLRFFALNHERTISKGELLEKVWGIYDSWTEQKVVEVYIGYLRKKLGKNSIETIKWAWYILSA